MADENALKKSPDAQFRFALSEDGMKLGVNRYFPPNGGKGPSVELLRSQVAAAGVQLPIDEAAAQRIVDAVENGNEYRGITLVRGIEAKEPMDGSLMALGDLKFPVFPEDRFARYRPAQKAANGQTIDGRVLKPVGNFTPDELTIKAGENVDWDATSECFVSQVWGMARVKDDVIFVDPIPIISDDAVEVRCNLHHKTFRGEAITPARIDKEMRDLGVTLEVDMDRLDAKLKQAAKKGAPLLDQVVVKGANPIPGRDGWLEYLVTTREAAGTEDASGRLDFRERGAYPMVEAGQIIGRLHPPTPGEGGIDIYGKTIPAHGGKELHVHLGENVTLLDDKVTFQSKAQGVVVMDRGVLSVTECLVIHGNVDLNTGNVKLENGSVKVLGSILSGFSVSAPKHVIVDGSIESADVYAGEKIEVSGGILMADGGKVVCDGDVISNFATNANIRAGGDVHIVNEIQNSRIHADGRLYAIQGKGIIHGGIITTGHGMEVNEIGSDLGVSTTVGVTIESHDTDELQTERQKVTQAIRKIDDTLGTDPPQVILSRTPGPKRSAVAEVLKHKVTLVKRRKHLSERINQLNLKLQEELRNSTITVKRQIHPGTTVRFGQRLKQIGKRLEACVLYWDVRNRDITIR